ncbi:hypothetical protein [Azospirillum sp. SYSU D00513]|uniref:hypothetical protein n=1 Tax=Azospirillum sp. SYSU D00513 TaxID=2812561 RepID=UPI001A957B60|nr:hypothetical protein [Azospirillum sp. SYSU D00513]
MRAEDLKTANLAGGGAAPAAGGPSARWGCSPAVDPFDARNQLRNGWQAHIRARLDAAGIGPFQEQCRTLALLAGAADPMAVWALLLWNSGAPRDLADGLRSWMRRGMPLPQRNPEGP